jgi:hypothetical protein
MGQLESSLSKEDLETLIEATCDWETIGNHEFHVMNWVKNCSIPPEDSESHEFIVRIKEHFKEREKEIRSMREIRQEKAIFLKAKLMLIKRDLAINQLFDNAAQPQAAPAPEVPQQQAPAEVTPPQAVAEAVTDFRQEPKPAYETIELQLELAEKYIKEVGIWTNYQNFVSEERANMGT